MSEINKEYLDALRGDVEQKHDDALVERFEALHPADIAEAFDALNAEEVSYCFKLLDDKERAANVLVELDEDVREALMERLTNREIIEEVLAYIDSDDAADVVSELPESRAEEVIAQLNAEEQEELISLMSYPEGTAGALMATELVAVQVDWSVAQSVREMRQQAEDVDRVHSIYAINEAGQLKGLLSTRRLLFASSSARSTIADLYDDEDTHAVRVDAPDEEVVQIMKKYDLVALPVVDEHQRLLGRITIDDVVDLMEDEAEKDYQLASGISEDVESSDGVWAQTRARLPWLLIGLGGGLAGAYIIGAFRIESFPNLMLFVPLIAAMGGNVGVQSAAIVVQGLANQSISEDNIGHRLVKELSVALVNAAICAAVIMLASIALQYDSSLSLTVSLALFAVIVFAALFGTFIPLLLNRVNIDPALATGPFITTANDIIGLIIYFSIGLALLP